MKLVLSGLALGAAMSIGVAQAEPLTLSADQMEQVTAAGNIYANVNFNKQINEKVRLDVFKSVFAATFVDGHLGDAKAAAQASGFNTLAETATIANVNGFHGFSDAFSESIAAAYP